MNTEIGEYSLNVNYTWYNGNIEKEEWLFVRGNKKSISLINYRDSEFKVIPNSTLTCQEIQSIITITYEYDDKINYRSTAGVLIEPFDFNKNNITKERVTGPSAYKVNIDTVGEVFHTYEYNEKGLPIKCKTSHTNYLYTS